MFDPWDCSMAGPFKHELTLRANRNRRPVNRLRLLCDLARRCYLLARQPMECFFALGIFTGTHTRCVHRLSRTVPVIYQICGRSRGHLISIIKHTPEAFFGLDSSVWRAGADSDRGAPAASAFQRSRCQ